MEYEIDDDPQGERDEPEGDRDGGIVEDHIALKNQSSVKLIQKSSVRTSRLQARLTSATDAI